MDLDELRGQLIGMMSFPVTPFASDGSLDLPRFREHVQSQLATQASAIFAACGTGEFVSLGLDEYEAIVRATVQEASGTGKPVFAGVGYGWALASTMAGIAEDAGADGILVLPPYLIQGDQEGMFAHYARIAEATSGGVIPYLRGSALLTPGTVARLAAIDNIIGLKDGVGDLAELMRIRLAADGRLTLMNGMPTAEISAYSHRACGVESYSSAVLNFVPELAAAFLKAFVGGDVATTDRLLSGFFEPFIELRDQGAGYAVSLVKAGVSLRAAPVGDTRPPLSPPQTHHREELERVIENGLALLSYEEPELVASSLPGGRSDTVELPPR